MTVPPEEPPVAEPDGAVPSVAERLAFYQRAGGIITPLFTVVLAFFAGGLVVLATGHNPLRTYKAIWDGTGLNWFFEFGHHHIDIPFTTTRSSSGGTPTRTASRRTTCTQTLILTTTLICTGLAVAFAFRCGLFNIGGQGQYITGAIVSVWVGSSWAGMAHGLHVFLAIALAMLAGAAIAAIAGFLKATVGAHEVITTIMLNWIAYWTGASCSAAAARCRTASTSRSRSRTTSSRAACCRRSGATRSSRRSTSGSSSRSARSSSSGSR